MYQILLNILFLFSAEKAHYLTLNTLNFIYNIPFGQRIIKTIFDSKYNDLEVEAFGLKFRNPVGLAAGFDKNAKYIDALACLGFGFIEIGTVTPLAQEGNPLPRLFRLKKDKAIINRMGFNNEGVDLVVDRLKKRKSKIIVGGNIGKNKITPNDKAVDDYIVCFNKLFDYVDYFVVNVSSPNTPNLRELQEKEKLFEILNSLQSLNLQKEKSKPILLKIAPDLNTHELDDIISVVEKAGIQGIICSNTTIDRQHLNATQAELEKIGNGGLSGAPIYTKSNKILSYLNQNSNTNLIGVGGIDDPASALEKFKLGSKLIQVYTGFIYQGPVLIKKINQAITNN